MNIVDHDYLCYARFDAYTITKICSYVNQLVAYSTCTNFLSMEHNNKVHLMFQVPP